ncbi:uncharacterized protein LOC124370428 [Homalodisca vitripennis]|uniref:uncharacterized protein LOC124370428 n=1 Tax=Homalodisca vitripennis TaxID=197043 RepID=UPI001EEC92AF|nr:uncharacterized protein LOC124370428 [Homalodisca vitripennis]
MSKVDIETLTNEDIAWRCNPCAAIRRRSMRLEVQAEQGKLSLEDVMQAINEIKSDQKVIIADFNKSHESLDTKLAETAAILRSQVDEMKKYREGMEKLEAENKALRNEIAALETRVEEQEMYSRRNCIEIQGIPEEPTETVDDVVDIVVKVGKAVNMDINATMIDACHRLGKKNDAARRGPRGIIVKFVRRLDKEELQKRKHQKRDLPTRHLGMAMDSTIYLNESLTPSRRRLYALARQAKKDKGYKYVWHRGGKVFLRKEDNAPVIQVCNQADLERL